MKQKHKNIFRKLKLKHYFLLLGVEVFVLVVLLLFVSGKVSILGYAAADAPNYDVLTINGNDITPNIEKAGVCKRFMGLGDKSHFLPRTEAGFSSLVNNPPRNVEVIECDVPHEQRRYLGVVVGDYCRPYVMNGRAEDKADIVFIGDGEFSEETFFPKIAKLLDYEHEYGNKGLFSIEPFKSNKEKFNIRYILAGDAINYWNNPAKGVIEPNPVDVKLLSSLLCPDADYTVLVGARDFRSYGIGSPVGMAILGNGAEHDPFLLVHEFGHAFTSLSDEYVEEKSEVISLLSQGANCVESYLLDYSPWKNLIGQVDYDYYGYYYFGSNSVSSFAEEYPSCACAEKAIKIEGRFTDGVDDLENIYDFCKNEVPIEKTGTICRFALGNERGTGFDYFMFRIKNSLIDDYAGCNYADSQYRSSWNSVMRDNGLSNSYGKINENIIQNKLNQYK
ncbi:MAG: hypothetical protein ABIH49_01585 [archaeon]